MKHRGAVKHRRPWWRPSSGDGSWTRPDDKAWHEPETPVAPQPAPDPDEVVLVPFKYKGISTLRAHYPNRSHRAP